MTVLSGSKSGLGSITAVFASQPKCANRQVIAFFLVPAMTRSFSNDIGGTFGSGGDSSKPPFSGSGRGSRSGSGDKGSGDKRDGWQCPNCGELCSHVDMFICEYQYY